MAQKPIVKDDDWEDMDWEDVTPPTPVTPANTVPPPPEQGFFSKAWHAISDPLTNAPTEWARQKSMEMTDPNSKPGWLKSFGAGALEGAGNLVSSFTSPLSLATLGAGGIEYGAGKAGLSQVARLANTGTRVLSAPVALHGAGEIIDPDASWGDRAMGALELAGGGAGMIHTPPVRPSVNPNVAEAVRKPGLMDDFRDIFNEVNHGTPPEIMDTSIGGTVDRIKQAEATLTEFNNSRVAKTLPRTQVEKPRVRLNSDGTYTRLDEPTVPLEHTDLDPELPAVADDVDAMVKELGVGDDAQWVDLPTEEVAGPMNNGSGDSDASLEAIRRAQSLKQKGQQFVVYTKTGEKKILGRGVDAHDYVAQGYLREGESFGLEDKAGNFQLLDDRGGKIPSPKAATMASKTDEFLSRDLQGAKPRFNVGTASYQPTFANDLDKALFIIAQKSPSRRDADFLRFVMEQTGLDESAARAAGMDIRKQILAAVKGQEPGPITISQMYGKTQKMPVSQVTPETMAGSGVGGGQPPLGPPLAPQAGPTPGQTPPTGGGPPVLPNAVPSALQTVNQQASMANPAQKAGLFANTQAFMRTLMTAYDISAPGRQGKGLITHGGFWRSFDDMFKAWGSDKAAQVVQDSITNHPSGYFKPRTKQLASGKVVPRDSIAAEAGLATGGKHGRPEMFGSKLAERLPGVKASERAYTAFLDKARSDVFAKLYAQAEKAGRGTPDVAKQIADSINTSTGIGSLGGLEESAKAMNILSNVFFAPKLMASRVQMYTRVLNPKTYTTLDPIVRKEALRSLLGIVGTGLLVGEVAKGLGADVSNDPTNTDFRKIKIGNSRIDNFSGLQQYGVAALRFLTGQSTSSVSGRASDLTRPRFGGQTRQDVIQNFATNKLAPIPSFVWAWMGNKEFDGTPFDAKMALVQRVVPLVIQDMYDIAKEDPSLIPLGLLPLVGEGVQTYGR